jgi:DNA/RNA endonuclease YhcR with UshA esterase domain
MNENTLSKISVVGVCISIIALYIITNQIFSSHVYIGDIDKSFIGKTVNITGEIVDVSETSGNYFIRLKDNTGEIKIILWSDTIELLKTNNFNINELKGGNKINVIGEIQIYKGELEVIPMRGNVNLI